MNEEKIENVQNEESTELTVVEPKIVPQVASMWNNTKMFNLSYKMAGFLSQSDLIPQAYKGNVGNCLIAIDISNRMGLSPMAVMQNSQVVRGKFSWTGSACKAMIDGCGRFRKPTVYREVGTEGTDSWGFYLEGEDKFGEIIKGPVVTVQLAKDENWYSRNPKWRSLQEIMLKYRAAAFFMRTECAGLAMGFLTSEENEDIAYADKTSGATLSEMLDKESVN
jgi:hypothetical protein